jgi:hypothetical protein
MATSLVWKSSGAAAGNAGGDTAVAGGGAATLDSAIDIARRAFAEERLGSAAVELGSRTDGERRAANVSWQTGI